MEKLFKENSELNLKVLLGSEEKAYAVETKILLTHLIRLPDVILEAEIRDIVRKIVKDIAKEISNG